MNEPRNMVIIALALVPALAEWFLTLVLPHFHKSDLGLCLCYFFKYSFTKKQKSRSINVEFIYLTSKKASFTVFI